MYHFRRRTSHTSTVSFNHSLRSVVPPRYIFISLMVGNVSSVCFRQTDHNADGSIYLGILIDEIKLLFISILYHVSSLPGCVSSGVLYFMARLLENFRRKAANVCDMGSGKYNMKFPRTCMLN